MPARVRVLHKNALIEQPPNLALEIGVFSEVLHPSPLSTHHANLRQEQMKLAPRASQAGFKDV